MGAALAIAGRVGTAMVKPEQLREFRKDFETIRASLPTAELHLRASRDLATARKTVADTKRAALDVGGALHRMHSTQSWRDSYGSWADLCRALGLKRRSTYDLMNLVKAIDISEIEPESITVQESRSILKASKPAAAPADPAVATQNVASATVARLPLPPAEDESPEDFNAVFAELNASLDEAVAKSDAPPKLTELEAPKSSPNATWAARQIGTLENWFEQRGAASRAAAHIQALKEIARSIG